MKEKEENGLIELPKVDVQSKLGTITDNLPIVKEQIERALKPYMGKEVSIENLQDAKKSRADLNKIYNTIDSKRKSIKREWNTPYKNWETNLKNSISFLTDCIADLDTKIKATEQKELDNKMAKIESIIEDRLVVEDESTRTFIKEISWFRQDKWRNKGESISKITKEIDATIDKVNQDLSIISRDKEFFSNMLEEYKKFGNLGDALALKDRLVIEKERREQLQRDIEAKRERERKELEEREEQKRKNEEDILKNSISSKPIPGDSSIDEKPRDTLFDMENSEPVEESQEEHKSIPLTNDNWEQTEYENRVEEQEQTPIQPIVEKPVEPKLSYNSPKDYIKVAIGYEFRTDVATARYLKELGIFLGAEVNIIVPPKQI